MRIKIVKDENGFYDIKDSKSLFAKGQIVDLSKRDVDYYLAVLEQYEEVQEKLRQISEKAQKEEKKEETNE